MIEIEKKVSLSDSQIERIKKEAIFLKETKIVDTYYDTKDFLYTLKNIWIRKRDSQFELKVGLKNEKYIIDRYREIVDKKKINEFLNFPIEIDIEENFKNNQISPFFSFVTYRTKYKLEDIFIDLDIAIKDDLKCIVGEFEIIVQDEKEIPIAENKLNDLTKKFDIDPNKRALSKLSYFLKMNNKNHFNNLVKANVIKEEHLY
ncbi:MAG: CYTH domain-containing protein [Parachlamydiales bacterium]|nr:CYTH domain-containing protein [Parachlamydiales bacterium]